VPVSNPPNPFESTAVEWLEAPPEKPVHVYEDHTRGILAQNDSPDLGFSFSVNPYRGCQHACAYCYARPTHEYLGFGAGTDFDTQIVVKPHAAELLREAFDKRSWRGEVVVFSGVTDCYQPLEASYKLTRACLEVCLEYRNPVGIITKAALVERDAELLGRMREVADVDVTMSIPFWDADKARAIEPYAPTPERRVRAIERLTAAGVPVGVNVAPIIPGLNDKDIGTILSAARAAGAVRAGMTLLRLPGSVRAVFEERLRGRMPLAADKVLHRIRETRGGKLNDSRFGIRQTGEGEYADTIQAFFDQMVRKLGFTERPPRRDTFQRPERGQLALRL
jgi:DNA repair photolyase